MLLIKLKDYDMELCIPQNTQIFHWHDRPVEQELPLPFDKRDDGALQQ